MFKYVPAVGLSEQAQGLSAGMGTAHIMPGVREAIWIWFALTKHPGIEISCHPELMFLVTFQTFQNQAECVIPSSELNSSKPLTRFSRVFKEL